MITRENIVEILKCEVIPALGCTEPAAVALACAAASNGRKPVASVHVIVSPNIYKNGMSVGIPGLKEVGIKAAAAIGAVGGDYKLGLQVLNSITEKDMDDYYCLVNNDKVSVGVSDNGENLYIEAMVDTEAGSGKCIIRGSHSNIVYLEHDGNVIIDKNCANKKAAATAPREVLKNAKIKDIIDLVDSMDASDLEFLMDGANMNKSAAEFGFKEKPGMAIGASIIKSIEKGILSDDLYHAAQAYTAAASDTRMAGYFIPVMSSAGSGNHGLTAILPVVVTAERLELGKEKLVKGLAVSHLVTVFIKNFTGRLSALCGCGVAASTGAAVAIAYMMGADFNQIEGTINNMVADVSGMICDGAKPGCALKLSTAAGVAVKAALLALNGSMVPTDNGIVGPTCEDTIKNLGRVSSPGMVETDRVILQTMVEKNHCC